MATKTAGEKPERMTAQMRNHLIDRVKDQETLLCGGTYRRSHDYSYGAKLELDDDVELCPTKVLRELKRGARGRIKLNWDKFIDGDGGGCRVFNNHTHISEIIEPNPWAEVERAGKAKQDVASQAKKRVRAEVSRLLDQLTLRTITRDEALDRVNAFCEKGLEDYLTDEERVEVTPKIPKYLQKDRAKRSKA